MVNQVLNYVHSADKSWFKLFRGVIYGRSLEADEGFEIIKNDNLMNNDRGFQLFFQFIFLLKTVTCLLKHVVRFSFNGMWK